MMETGFLKKRLDKEFESAAGRELEDYLLVRSFPGFWTVHALPQDFKSPDLVEEYARTLAIREGVQVILVRNGREYVHFHCDGRRSATFRHRVSETR